MNERHIFFVIYCLITIMCQAQQMVPNNLPTPNASDLGMYGNIPVSYYTGKPNISIPIASLKEPGGIELPVYLQHDASGVMVNNLPS